MNKRLVFSLTIYLLATSTLFAQGRPEGRSENRPEGGRPEVSDELRQVIDDCHTSLNIARPERPTERRDRDSQPTAEEIAKMKLADANREKIRACVESKGYHMPEFGHGGPGAHAHHGRPPQDGGGSSTNDDSSSSSSDASSTAQ